MPTSAAIDAADPDTRCAGASGIRSADSAPANPNTAKAMTPHPIHRAASSPTTAPMPAMTNTDPTRRAVLSLVPKIAMAASFTPGGTVSMTNVPTASSSEGTLGQQPGNQFCGAQSRQGGHHPGDSLSPSV